MPPNAASCAIACVFGVPPTRNPNNKQAQSTLSARLRKFKFTPPTPPRSLSLFALALRARPLAPFSRLRCVPDESTAPPRVGDVHGRLAARVACFSEAENKKKTHRWLKLQDGERQLSAVLTGGGPPDPQNVTFSPSRHRKKVDRFVNRREFTGLGFADLPSPTARSGRPLANFGLAS
jgi:hypothetical protein